MYVSINLSPNIYLYMSVYLSNYLSIYISTCVLTRNPLVTYLNPVLEPGHVGLGVTRHLALDDRQVALLGLDRARLLHEHGLLAQPATGGKEGISNARCKGATKSLRRRRILALLRVTELGTFSYLFLRLRDTYYQHFCIPLGKRMC